MVQQLEVVFCPLAASGQVVARASATVLKDPVVLTRTGGDIAKNVNQTPEPIFLAHFHPLYLEWCLGLGEARFALLKSWMCGKCNLVDGSNLFPSPFLGLFGKSAPAWREEIVIFDSSMCPVRG